MGTMDKPNRTQTRKKSRESMFEIADDKLNSQNDIKKLRKENEQLRREIWGLRDEYDKLEEILKQQKLKGNSDNSDTNTEYSEYDDRSDEEDEEINKNNKKKELIGNKENMKLSEEMHRLRVDFDELSVVNEEEELAKIKEQRTEIKNQSCNDSHRQALNKDIIHDTLSLYSIPYEPYSPGFIPECPFIFPSPSLSFPDKPLEGSILLPPCPPMYANDTSPFDNLDTPRPVSTVESHLGSTGFPSVSDLDKSSSEASIQTRSTKVVSNSNLLKLSPTTGDNAYSIPKDVQKEPEMPDLESLKKPKHFFAPLAIKLQNEYKTKLDKLMLKSDSLDEKGSVDICVNGAPVDNHQPTFLSSENLYVNSDTENRNSSSNLVKSLSCHDLPKSDISSVESKSKHTKSENALDSTGSFRTRVNITLKPLFKPPTPTTPEVPKLPSFDSKLFTNRYHQHFEQYRNYMHAMKKPLNIKVPDTSNQNFCPGFYGFIPIPPRNGLEEKSSDTLEQYQALLLNGKVKSPKDIQVTSFETPSPRTLQIPPMTPYDLNLIYSKLPGLTPDTNCSDLYHKLPILTKDGTVTCPNDAGLKVQCEACLKKIPSQTQSSMEENSLETDQKKLKKPKSSLDSGPACIASQKRKERMRKQLSTTSSDIPETLVDFPGKRRVSEDKNESRSSSSGGESPKKDYKRMSIYFNPKKRPSISSTKTSKSLSLDANKSKSCTGSDTVDSVGTGSDKEKTHFIIDNEKGKKKNRKSSTSSESVPWCACWGNGCI